jgi:restriction endonuclease S subunit
MNINVINKVSLGEVLEYEQPTNYIVDNTDYDDEFEIPVLTAGKTFLLGYTNETHNVFSNVPVIIFDDFTTAFKYVDFPFKVKSSAMKILKANKEIADIKFLYYRMMKTGVDTELHKRYWISKYSKVKIPLPPLDQQKKIAAILDAADAYRQKTKALITKYDELTQSLFLDMFGDPVRNPKGWEKRPMGELMTIVRGGSPRPIDKFLGGTYPWIKIGDATKGDDIYLNSTKQSIIESGLSKTRLLPKGSLIFANCGVSLGFARIINIEGCIHDGWLAFSDLNPSLSKLFLLKALNNITRYFRETAPDGTQPNLNSGIMKSFEIILPPIRLQNKFELSLLELTKQKAQASASLVQAEDLFNSLLQRAFKGELV